MSLFTAPIFKKVIFWLEFTLSFKKNHPRPLERLSIPNWDLIEKIGKVVIKYDKF